MFIANGTNKANLFNYIGERWMDDYENLPVDVNLIICGIMNDPGKTVLISHSGCEVIPELSCRNHEEADTRMFAHLYYSVSNHHSTQAVIQTTDTDGVVIAMYYSVRIPNL